MSVLKQISASVQAPPSQAVTNAGTFATQTTIQTSTSGGASVSTLVSGASTNATSVKGSAGTVYGIQVGNINASPRYLKLHNTSGTPTAGSGVVATFIIPGSASGAGSNIVLPPQGLAFSTGIGFTITGGITASDTTAINANECIVNIEYA